MDKDVEVRAKTFSTLGFYLFLPRKNSLANQDSLFSSRPKRARQQHPGQGGNEKEREGDARSPARPPGHGRAAAVAGGGGRCGGGRVAAAAGGRDRGHPGQRGRRDERGHAPLPRVRAHAPRRPQPHPAPDGEPAVRRALLGMLICILRDEYLIFL